VLNDIFVELKIADEFKKEKKNFKFPSSSFNIFRLGVEVNNNSNKTPPLNVPSALI